MSNKGNETNEKRDFFVEKQFTAYCGKFCGARDFFPLIAHHYHTRIISALYVCDESRIAYLPLLAVSLSLCPYVPAGSGVMRSQRESTNTAAPITPDVALTKHTPSNPQRKSPTTITLKVPFALPQEYVSTKLLIVHLFFVIVYIDKSVKFKEMK